MDATAGLPLFPLHAVLFPGGPLPLRIFEPRYVDMVRRCMRERRSFGVVQIRAGDEAGEVTQAAAVGTSARIVDFYPLPDGLLGITCHGERRFRLLRRSRAHDGLNVGEVEWLAPPDAAPVPPQFQYLADLLRNVLPQLGELYAALPRHFEDASWVGARVAEILPISLSDKQACLEVDGVARLARLAPLIRRGED
ncbi:MAG: LON peptidase substrate-binding domain-containing protein [Steroidobacteraceae bacterium]